MIKPFIKQVPLILLTLILQGLAVPVQLIAAESTAESINSSPRWSWNSEQEASIEVGAGVGAIHIPHYIGSKQTSSYALPLPYARYQSKYLKADRKGVRGLIFSTERLELTLSSSLSLPVDSSDNQLRENMPDLKTLFELGPSLNYQFFQSANSAHSLDLQLPIRAALSFDDLSISHEGWITSPQLEYQYFADGWKINVNLGSSRADQEYAAYFYQVDSQYQTANRIAYQAESGHIATRLATSISYRKGQWYFGGFANYYDAKNSANQNSPLFETDNNYSVGLFIARIIASRN